MDCASAWHFSPSSLVFPGKETDNTAMASTVLLAELDDAINDRSPAGRVEILRQVMNLFLADVDRLNAVQIEVFDDVLVRLIERAEARTLAQLSSNLCGLTLAPRTADQAGISRGCGGCRAGFEKVRPLIGRRSC